MRTPTRPVGSRYCWSVWPILWGMRPLAQVEGTLGSDGPVSMMFYRAAEGWGVDLEYMV